MIRLRSDGRGTNYGPLHGALESVLRVAYRGDWPARLWARVPGADRVRVIERTLRVLPQGAAPLRIGFASDLHFGPTTPPALLDAAKRALAAARLDVLLLGGDYVYLDATDARLEALVRWLEGVPAREKLAVLGNHDLWTEHHRVEAALREGGARVLVNECVPLRANERVAVVGLDEPWTGNADARAFGEIGADVRTVIVLCHSPEAVPMARREMGARGSGASAMYVCGHTHGGHVAMPWGPLFVPGRFGRRHPSGVYAFPELSLFVSRGIGATEVAARLFAPPDVFVFTLEPVATPLP